MDRRRVSRLLMEPRQTLEARGAAQSAVPESRGLVIEERGVFLQRLFENVNKSAKQGLIGAGDFPIQSGERLPAGATSEIPHDDRNEPTGIHPVLARHGVHAFGEFAANATHGGVGDVSV